MKNKKRYKLVGEGDDSIDGWNAPISDYQVLINAVNVCEEADVDFPIRELILYIRKSGFSIKIDKTYSIGSTEDILEAIIKPYFSVNNDQWGGDSPGQSGFYQKGYLELGHTKLVRKILRTAEEFIVDWEKELASKKPQEALVSVAELSVEKIFVPQEDIGETISREWEDKLYDQVKTAIEDNLKLVRFNYLVYQGTIFYLNRSWWHTVPGSIESVTTRLRSAGFAIVDCNVVTTKRGWISYFARSKEEENNLGWNEASIEVSCPTNFIKKLEEARELNMDKPYLYSISLYDFGVTPISSGVFMRESLEGYDVFIHADEYIDPPMKIGSLSNEIYWKNFAETLKNLKEGHAFASSINNMHVTGISGLRAECLKYAWAYQDDSEDGYKEILDFLLSVEEKTIDYLEDNFDIVWGGKDFFSFIEIKDHILEDSIREFLFSLSEAKYALDAASISRLLNVGSIENEEKLKLKNKNNEKLLAIYSEEIENISSKFDDFRARSAFAPPSDKTLVRNYLKKYLLENEKMPVGQHRVEIHHLGKVYGPGVITLVNDDSQQGEKSILPPKATLSPELRARRDKLLKLTLKGFLSMGNRPSKGIK